MCLILEKITQLQVAETGKRSNDNNRINTDNVILALH